MGVRQPRTRSVFQTSLAPIDPSCTGFRRSKRRTGKVTRAILRGFLVRLAGVRRCEAGPWAPSLRNSDTHPPLALDLPLLDVPYFRFAARPLASAR